MSTPGDPDNPFVSVIIPVHNDGERLRTCLTALSRQTYGTDRFEVIVVDNGSKVSPGPIVADFPFATFTIETRPGSYCARNHGLSLARGEMLAFTDADCVPRPDWLEKGIAAFRREPDAGLVGGKIQVFFKDPGKPTFVEVYESVRAFPQHDYIHEHRYGATANMITSRAVMDRVGKFNDQLKSSGDKDFGNRTDKAGLKLIYADDAVVEHPARYSWGELYKKTARIAAGHWQMDGKPRYTFGKMLLDFRPPVQSWIGWWSNEVLKGANWWKKTQVISVFTFMRYVTAYETWRVYKGAAATR
jgi:cellulose synthase/poly-beta-1,6-N-acetylglucosamine synthase-like glycosyltransferase